jgi:hypothetical protein
MKLPPSGAIEPPPHPLPHGTRNPKTPERLEQSLSGRGQHPFSNHYCHIMK